MSTGSARILLAGAFAIGLVASALAETAAPEPGLAVGQRAPDFALVDQTGERRSLATLLERGKLALVFYRSADW